MSYWLNPKTEGRSVPGRGEGLFAVAPIAAGEVIVAWDGVVLTRADFDLVPQRLRENSIQIGDDAFLVPEVLRPGDHVNHSCAPNAGLRGDRTLVAMRDIAPGEQVGYDYATSDGSNYDEFECACGAPTCRGRITGSDWTKSALLQRLRGWFSPYLARRMSAPEGLP